MLLTYLDLRLLEGDLTKPNKKSAVVQAILTHIKRYEGRTSCKQILLAGSGYGKTKAIFDVAKIIHTFYLDFSSQQADDIKQMFKNIGGIHSRKNEVCDVCAVIKYQFFLLVYPIGLRAILYL
jgi:hypothetical protein